ncbi:hypothetical protein [Agromyces sp. Marseille-Q5079]|uniref:hypothetical protein n=1 Tax=Agromyces sp. Marseille-Q5079 TaxID=3439059 RepID=UPI003D9C9929
MRVNPSRLGAGALALTAGLMLVALSSAPATADEQVVPATGPAVSETDPALDPSALPEAEAETEADAPASPAAAEVFEPVIQVENTVYPEGDWLDGIHVTGSGFVTDAPLTGIGVRAGQGTVGWELIDVAPDGTIDAVMTPGDFAAADSPDRLPFTVKVTQGLADGSNVFSNEVQLTITAAVPAEPVDGPPVVAPSAETESEAGPRLAETGVEGGILTAALALVAGGLLVTMVGARRRLAAD